MSVYSLMFDNEFISADAGGDIVVYFYEGEYADDFNMFGATNCWSDDNWGSSTSVGPTSSDLFRALEVFGTTIAGYKFIELCDELSALAKGGLSVLVNRLGHCIIHGLGHSSTHNVRIHDRFGWSKYGVKLPHQDAIVVGSDGLRRSLEERNVELEACKKELEAKSAELKECKEELDRSKEERDVELTAHKKELKAWKKEAEEKSVELAACRKELEWSRKNELLWSKLVEEKEKVNEMMQNNQILAFQAADN
ncbi:unnamed protein product [Linum tenue]|uniref:Uncharacterized protein n=1 Tax=Linum tenue TaxID=586396 RepID=A0AAV0JE97_9ROSI|nr:unnamed protein product [Linum tenue]